MSRLGLFIFALIVAISALASAAFIGCAGNSGDDDSSSADDASDDASGGDDTQSSDDDTSASCASNTLPDLLSLDVLVNGVGASSPVQVYQGDTVTFYVQYDDVDCNLAGGTISFKDGSDNVTVLIVLPGDLPCSSDIGGAFVPTVPVFDLFGPVSVSGELYLTDNCGAESSHLPMQFEILAPAAQ